MNEERSERGNPPGYYYSGRLSLVVQITALEHPLPACADWEFLGSSSRMTPSEAIRQLLRLHPDIDSDRLSFTVK